MKYTRSVDVKKLCLFIVDNSDPVHQKCIICFKKDCTCRPRIFLS